ncbi:MAG: tRNA pseudouridine(55) synthase TruB [SAR202 cluster bacterium]|nr:tRNA pseudouridine(55) synthase TruB [SAR202 cluster bacterium]
MQHWAVTLLAAEGLMPADGQLNGILNINKPSGITSMDVVRRIRRASGQKRVGNAGTLDPIASGVLPVCLGQGTRMVEHLMEGKKVYRATFLLGVETDTYDSDGTVVRTVDPSAVRPPDLEGVLKSFHGEIDQLPPMYSAIKVQSRRLYDLARSGEEVERTTRKVRVYSLEIIETSLPSFTVDITCGRGFYVRSLGHDVGERLGCGAHMTALERRRVGPFDIESATGLDVALVALEEDRAAGILRPFDAAVEHLQAVTVGPDGEAAIRHGRPVTAIVPPPSDGAGSQIRVYTSGGRFLALLVFDQRSGGWRSDKVFL